jgi:hypothetical protein
MRLTKILLIVGAAMAVSCGGALPGMGGGGGGMSAECSGDWGSGDAALKMGAFMGATADFIGAAADIEESLTAACRDMGTELGIPAEQMEGGGDVPAVKAACNAVSAKLEAELGELSASASLQIAIVATPPVCEVSVDAYANCVGECEVDVDPGEVDIQCEGGELRGGCSGSCTGSCSVEGSASCSGSCEGTCEGGCQGTCNGRCDGTCSAQGSNGECAGSCSGTCHGTCSASCQGSCQGSCVVEAQASCQGECRGSCSVEFTEPRCTGTVRPPSASASCQASCDAKLDARAECKPGNVTVAITGNIDSNIEERVGRLRNALESGLPAIRALGAKLGRLVASGELMISAGGELGGAVGGLGLRAGQCIAEATAALPRAAAQVSVSVEVSASVSASAGAG